MCGNGERHCFSLFLFLTFYVNYDIIIMYTVNVIQPYMAERREIMSKRTKKKNTIGRRIRGNLLATIIIFVGLIILVYFPKLLSMLPMEVLYSFVKDQWIGILVGAVGTNIAIAIVDAIRHRDDDDDDDDD